MLSEKAKRVINQAMANSPEGDQISAEIEKIATGGAIAPAASPDATDLATAQTLVNELKAQFNALLAAMS